MADLLKNPKLCGACGKPGCKLKCACKLVFYCGAECQGEHWPAHTKECTVWLAKKIREARREHGKDGCKVAEAKLAEARFEAAKELKKQGRYRDAERCYLDARRIAVDVEGADGFNVGKTSLDLGGMYGEMGRHEEAMTKLHEGLRIMRNIKGERCKEAAEALGTISQTLCRQGKNEEALAMLEEVHSIFLETVGPENFNVGATFVSKGNCYAGMGRLEEARAAFEESLRINRIAYGDDSQAVADSLQNLGTIFGRSGMLDEARANLEEALRIQRRVHGERHPSVANALNNIAKVLDKQGQLDEALKMFSKTLKIKRRVLGENHQDVAGSLMNIGDIHCQRGKYDEALEMYEEALSVSTRALGIDNDLNAGLHYKIAKSKLGSFDAIGALESARESVRIYSKLGIDNQASREIAHLLTRVEGIVASMRRDGIVS